MTCNNCNYFWPENYDCPCCHADTRWPAPCEESEEDDFFGDEEEFE